VKHRAITPTFGAYVEDLDIARLTPASLRRLYELWQQRHLLVLRGQRTDSAAFKAFAASLGDCEAMPAMAGGETQWGSELSSAQRPPFACLLRSAGAHDPQGAMWFACLPAALRSIAPDLVARLRWLALQHGPNVHPMVVMHPETGEHTLYLGQRRNAHIPGVPAPEADRLLNIVWSYATAEAVTWRHRWQPGDVVLWNNLTLLHKHEPLPADAAPSLEGLRVKGRYTLSAPIQQEAA
jgi:alpha-ketoglutarate-dependent taurine dioxygenase